MEQLSKEALRIVADRFQLLSDPTRLDVRRRVEGNHVLYVVADDSLPKLCDILKESLLARHDELLASLEDDSA